jgi:hypothetical protein
VDTGFTLDKRYFWIQREIEKIRNTILNNKPMFLFKFIRYFNAAQIRTIATFYFSQNTEFPYQSVSSRLKFRRHFNDIREFLLASGDQCFDA